MGAILVTGGAGYVGSHAVKALVRAGREVIVYDDLSAGHRKAVLGAPLVEARLTDREALRQTLARGVSAVMHFAAVASVGESVRKPALYYETNVEGTLALLQAMVEAGVRHLVFSSTAAVYGEPQRTPIDEEHPTAPINPYGETKLAIERALPYYAGAYGLGWAALRYFNAAGADPDGELGEDHTPELHLIPRALDAAAGGPPLQVFGEDYPTPDGTCLRDYVHVSDLADAHLLVLERLEGGGEPGVYNLGNGRPFSVREVLDAVARVTGRQVPWTPAPRRAGDPAVLLASSDRIRQAVGWSPRFGDLDRMVDTAWRWRRAHPSGYADGPFF